MDQSLRFATGRNRAEQSIAAFKASASPTDIVVATSVSRTGRSLKEASAAFQAAQAAVDRHLCQCLSELVL